MPRLTPRTRGFFSAIPLLIVAALPASLHASAADERIEQAARASFNYRVILAQQVTITAREGVVTLTGTVEDDNDRALAAATIEAIPGIVRVVDELNVQPSAARYSDPWIALMVRRNLLLRANVSPAAIFVEVNDRIVVLTGTVETQSQKALAETCVRAVGRVQAIRNELVVAGMNPAAHDAIDDASITAQVRFAISTGGSTRGLKVAVITGNGIVTVSGEAPSSVEKALVALAAEGVRGVQSVTNNMSVRL